MKSLYSYLPYFIKDFLFLKRIHSKITEVYINLGEESFSMLLLKNEAVYHKIKKTQIYEPGVTKIIIENLGSNDTFIDLGSGQGYFSLLAAKIINNPQKVHAFDPHKIWGEVFILNNQRYAKGKINFKRAWVGNGNSSVTYLDKYSTMTNKELTLDSYCNLHNCYPTFIKMDIESGEVLAVKGMTNIIERCKPKLLIELHPNLSKKLHDVSVYDFVRDLESLGYSLLYNINPNDATNPWIASVDKITESTTIFCEVL